MGSIKIQWLFEKGIEDIEKMNIILWFVLQIHELIKRMGKKYLIDTDQLEIFKENFLSHLYYKIKKEKIKFLK